MSTSITDLLFLKTPPLGRPRDLLEEDNNLLIIKTALLKAPQLVAQSYAGWSRTSDNSTDTVYFNLATITIPGGTMGVNSKLQIIADWDLPNPGTSSTKFISLDFGAASISVPTATTSTTAKLFLEIQNLNSLAVQKTMATVVPGLSANSRVASAVDTTIDADMVFKCKWGANQATPETISLLGYSIYHFPGN